MVLDAIGENWRNRGRGPSHRELAAQLGITDNSAYRRVTTLLRNGSLVADWSEGRIVAGSIRPSGTDVDKSRELLRRFVFAYAGVDMAAEGKRLGEARREIEMWRVFLVAAEQLGVNWRGFGRAPELAVNAAEAQRRLDAIAEQRDKSRKVITRLV